MKSRINFPGCDPKGMIEEFQILPVSGKNQESCVSLLREHITTSLFLLDNLSRFGLQKGEHPHSGDWFCLTDSHGYSRAILVALKKGHLLYQADSRADYSKQWSQFLQAENITPTGLIGDWRVCRSLWQSLNESFHITPEFKSLEVLFDYNINEQGTLNWENNDPSLECRLLTPADFESWHPLRTAYLQESGMTVPPESNLKATFLREVSLNFWWGAWQANQLVAIAALKLISQGIGQVAGVYTKPEYRKRGIGKIVMHQLFDDSDSIHNLSGLVIFTGETNLAAQRLYESLGCRRIGNFCLIF